MSTRYFALTPLDAWFFRDGRPYNEKEANQADVPSVFPPPARTLSGALRAALARGNGWSGRGRWPDALNRTLGSGPDELGSLRFTGPFLLKDGQALWPVPRHVLGRAEERWNPAAFLRPDKSTNLTDAGKINLPIIALSPGAKGAGLKPAETAWITNRAMHTVLGGELPSVSDIFSADVPWSHEARVGLRRDETTLTAAEGALYSPAYVRLRRGVALGVSVAGVPDGMNDVPSLFPLGGESRLAQSESWAGDSLPAPQARESFTPDAVGRIHFIVSLLTPGCFAAPDLPGAEIVSACVGKAQFIGGWDSLQRQPLPLQPFAPAGSVWFCTAAVADFAVIHAWHGKSIGPHAVHGFGQIVIGHWPPTYTAQP